LGRTGFISIRWGRTGEARVWGKIGDDAFANVPILKNNGSKKEPVGVLSQMACLNYLGGGY